MQAFVKTGGVMGILGVAIVNSRKVFVGEQDICSSSLLLANLELSNRNVYEP